MVDVRYPLGLPSSSIQHQKSASRFFTAEDLPATPDSNTSKRTEIRPPTRFLPSNRDLVAVANPELTLAIRRLIQPLGLSRFDTLQPEPSTFPLGGLAGSRTEVEEHLAPYSLMASATKSFISLLVDSGMAAANVDWLMAGPKVKVGGRYSRKAKQNRDRLLTPSHIIRGLTGGSIHREGTLNAASLCLSRLGMVVGASSTFDDSRVVGMETQGWVHGRASSGLTVVKAEDAT